MIPLIKVYFLLTHAYSSLLQIFNLFMIKIFSASWLISLSLALISFSGFGQSKNSAEIYHELLQLKETRRILYVAAHPDDENTRLIAYMVNGLHSEVAYLSLTRGDGGQNLLGKELGIGLGQIRTQELIKARETDGGRQFFTRAMDFGYSKDPTETLQNWDKEKVLSDVVWVIRKFQPDIIITRFNTIPGVTHGHHTTSAILAGEAFDLAGDPKAFPEQLDQVATWQAKRIFWNAYNFGGEFREDSTKTYDVFPTGDFNSLLGESYSQIAADSRTMHKSQGFGATAGKGEAVDHIQFLKGEPFTNSAFDGVEDRWVAVPNGKVILTAIDKLIGSYNFKDPSQNVTALLAIRKNLKAIPKPPIWVVEKLVKLDQLIISAMGLDFEFVSRLELGYAGQQVSAQLVFNNPTLISVTGVSLKVGIKEFEKPNESVKPNEPLILPVNFTIPEDAKPSQPYWLEKPIDGALYNVSNQDDIGKPFNEVKLGGILAFTINDQNFSLEIPLMYKFNDQVDGEVKQPFTIVPEIDLSISDDVVFLIPEVSGKIKVVVRFNGQMLDGSLDFKGLPADQYRILEVTDNTFLKERMYEVEFLKKGQGISDVTARYTTSQGKVFELMTYRILYKHIPNLTYFKPASIRLIQEDWKVSKAKLGYIAGAGDDIPGVLTSLGYQVEFIGPNDYSVEKLSRYKAVIVGIRAYNTNENLASNQQILMGYVKSGGKVIVQYNTSSPLLTNQLGPYPFVLSRNRVAVQNSPVRVDWNHPLVSGPNPLKEADFDNWVQERGLYFVGQMDERYETPFQMNDPGEDPSDGALIYAKFGEGKYIYTGISFFRQLPAGVVGATKLFINLIEE
jgi:LmbE family N-acetylglucosaminyl deacetylase